MARAGLLTAHARELFLSSGTLDIHVREDIMHSWRRSHNLSIEPEVEAPYVPSGDPESKLLRAARPVLNSMQERLGDLDIGFILTDAEARILEVRVGDRRLARGLDEIGAGPGFVFAEDVVGTNGLGTPIENGRVTRIDGHEHYGSRFVNFTCVGVPITDPLDRQVLGVLDVSCTVDPGNTLVTLIAERTAREIENCLLEQQSVTERVLLTHFMAASRRSRAGIVVLSERMIFTNPRAARLLDRDDHPLLWENAQRIMSGGSAVVDEVVLSGGRSAQTRTTPLRDGGDVLGAIIEIRPTSQREENPIWTGPLAIPTTTSRRVESSTSVGRRASRIENQSLEKAMVVVYGETGVGKCTLAKELLGDKHTVIVDASSFQRKTPPLLADLLPDTLMHCPGGMILRRLDILSAPHARQALSVMVEARNRGWSCAVTYRCDDTLDGSALAGLSTREVRVPPLRDRIAEIPNLISAFAAPVRVAPEVIQLFMRVNWAGNVAELRATVKRMVEGTPAGTAAGLRQVPPEIRRAAFRRNLSRFERAEARTVLDAIADAGGNKRKAAKLLGISRSTLYRKLQAAGVDIDRTTF